MNIRFDTRELAIYLNISIGMVRKLIRNDELPYMRIGAKILINKSDIDVWLLSRTRNLEDLEERKGD